MVETLTKFNGLFWRNSSINGSLYFFDRRFASTIYERCYVKEFPGMSKHIFSNGTRRFSKNITENIVQLKIGYSKTIQSTILLTCNHTGKLETVSYKSLKWRMSAGGIKEGLIISHMNRVSKSVVDFFSDKSEEEIQKYIALCEQAELIKN